jgi:cytochrome c-type biogenesis protein CcmE
MGMKRRHTISLAVIFAFVIFSSVAYKNSLTPYVTFAAAKNIQGIVQVRGTLTGETVAAAANGKTITFRLRDETGQEALVVYNGTKPEGFEQASDIVAIGRYQNNQFMAEKLLVKCPSKYQGSVKP